MQLIRTIRTKWITLSLTVMMAMQLLNVSIDPVDPFPFAEDLSINEIESVVELLVEHVFDNDNIITEMDEDDSGSEKTPIAFTLFSSAYHIELYPTFTECPTRPSVDYCDHFKSPNKTIHTPPPKA